MAEEGKSMTQPTNTSIRTQESLVEHFGDVRQAFDQWLSRAQLYSTAAIEVQEDIANAIGNAQRALDRLADYIPQEAT